MFFKDIFYALNLASIYSLGHFQTRYLNPDQTDPDKLYSN